MAEIKVVCIQAHQTPAGEGRFNTFVVGEKYLIDESAFSPYLFKKEDPAQADEIEKGDDEA